MRDSMAWVMLLVACAVVGILGFRYYKATQQIALLTETTSQLAAELEGVTEVHKMAEAKSAKEVRRAEQITTKLAKSRDKVKAEVRSLKKELAKARQERDGLKAKVTTLKSDSEKLKGDVRALRVNKKKLEGKVQAMQVDKEELDHRLVQREKEVAALQRTMREREAKLQQMEKARRADQESLQAWQGTTKRLVEERKKLQAKLRVVGEDLEQATLLQVERAAEVHELAEALKQREEHITTLRRRLAELGAR
ncbi:MAG: hypothetical protein V3S57_06370 [candidate division NC10 bacterium]